MTLNQDVNGNDLPMVESTDKPELNVATKIAMEKILVLILLNGANYKRYAIVHNQLANQFTQGTNSYPNITESTVRFLNNYKPIRHV